ncbi:unnamed protein product [Vitrella brassicaformis CCMP3155]|uniref:Thiamine pyrimidine synthase n=1 Tax=Vitrella brassicaformis (strain CCMP3155) TaxID=1169540 RepID=A0A0G4GWZ5_VITBC|nr:unnamed protein product [Vitrella brassicaformis CCMP3155]|eukprot:CEM35571.1 unnamed protein product [Vitrella brassicaformis CCMP3155]
MQQLRIALDWTPNTNHTGIYVAIAKSWYKEEGLDVVCISPDEPSTQGSEAPSEPSQAKLTPARKVAAGEADFAVTPSESAISFHTTEPSKPRLVAVAALLQKSTSAIVTMKASGISRPRDLDGKAYASYEGRFEMGIVKQMVRNDGGRGDVEEKLLNFHGYQDQETMKASSVVESMLRASKADATWIFTHWEGVLAERLGSELTYFKLEDYAVPYGYSPVLLCRGDKLKDAAFAASVKSFLKATARGYAFAETNRQEAAKLLCETARHASLADTAFVAASQDAITGSYLTADGGWGRMEEERWQELLQFLAEHEIVTDRAGEAIPAAQLPPAADLFTNEMLPCLV